MAGYQCPLCGKQMDRDLILFLDHTNQHVIDRIRRSHPEWIAENGACEPCVEYYRLQISGEAGNIGPNERRKRAMLGIAALGLTVAAGFYLVASNAPSILRLSLCVPLFCGIFCLMEAGEATCSVLAEMGSRNVDSGVEKIPDASVVGSLKRRGRQILIKSASAAIIITFVFFFMSGGRF